MASPVDSRRAALLESVGGATDLDRRTVYEMLVATGGYDASLSTFAKDIDCLGIGARFRDGRRNNKGRPPDESTVKLREWLVENMKLVNESEGAVGVRRVYYILLGEAEAWFGPGVFEKGEGNYAKVSSELARLRRGGIVPYDWIVESGRSAALNDVHEWGVAEFVKSRLDPWVGMIERDPWRETTERCEIWFEKDTISHVFAPVCAASNVPMVSCHGMSSITLLRDAAVRIAEQNRQGRTVTVYYFGDLDKSGLDIANNVRVDLANHADRELDWNFVHLGIHPQQVERHGFLTHPRKKAANERRTPRWAPPGWDAETVCELDAASPELLRQWAETAIRNHLTEEMIKRNDDIEREWKEAGAVVIGEIRRRCSDIVTAYEIE